MMSWIGGVIVVGLFALLFKLFRLVDITRNTISLAKASVVVMQDQTLSDLQKEQLAQKNALGLFKSFFLITTAGSSAVILPFCIIWLLDIMGVMSFDAVLTTTLSWQFLLGCTLVACLVIWLLKKNER